MTNDKRALRNVRPLLQSLGCPNVLGKPTVEQMAVLHPSGGKVRLQERVVE